MLPSIDFNDIKSTIFNTATVQYLGMLTATKIDNNSL